jgi:hypothetical protein
VTALAIVFAVLALKSRWERQNTHLAMQQELVRLNTPSMLRYITPSVTLTPGTLRSAEAEKELTVPADVDSVALGLLWTQQERFLSYQVTIRRLDEDVSFTIPNLQLDSGNLIRLQVPTRLVTPGLYRIQVSGVVEVTRFPEGNATTSSEEYQFVVRE